MNMEQLQKENDELKKLFQDASTIILEKQIRINELEAYVERLRETMIAYCETQRRFYGDAPVQFEEALEETPAQPLRHIETRVEEETIERCADECEEVDSEYLYEFGSAGAAAERLRNQPRKYKEQSDED